MTLCAELRKALKEPVVVSLEPLPHKANSTVATKSPMRSALLILTVAATAAADTYWWKFEQSDCGYDDVSPQPACGAQYKGDVDNLKACCAATKGCGGFNTNGIIKKTDCLSNKKAEPRCDLYVLEDHPEPPPPPPVPANLPWPYPNTRTPLKYGDTRVQLAAGFKFNTGGKTCATLDAAIARYEAIALKGHSVAPDDERSPAAGASALSSLAIAVDDLDESHPQLGLNETYSLSVPADGSTATLQAPNIYAAMHGLETFSQLVRFDFNSSTYGVPNAPWVIDGDAPRFTHRGLMIDTARHFETLASIRGIVDSLPYSKINVLHWHMVDSQSYPFESKTHPKLWDGAYSDQERYTQRDIAAIVEYARLRGVRVMVEFDMPGHAASWCKGYPEICPSTTCTQPLNVANNATFDLIEGVLGECTGGKSSQKGAPSGLFPDNMIHLGGDEVDTACWTKDATISKWLSDRGMSADDGYAYFVKQTAAIALSQGRQPVQWSEVFDHFKTGLPKEVIVHIWKSVTNVTEVVADGYRTLVNVGYDAKSWYLDNLNVKWDAVYSNEPCDGVPDDLCDKYVLGGHGEMWGETVDASDVEQTVWPRLAAIGERLWSPRTMTDTGAALPRIERFRCLLNRRGVRAAPVTNDNARSAPSGPGSCFDQR